MAPKLPPEHLDQLVLRAILREWAILNENCFGYALAPPVVRLIEGRSLLGRWVGATRVLELSRALVYEQPWNAVVEVLKHEAAHQYVEESLGVRDEVAHGPVFQDVCRRFHIDPGAVGLPSALDANAEPGAGKSRVVERVAKLLALATSANEHEAETAMNAAQRLMLEHNLSEVSRPERRFVSRLLAPAVPRLEEARTRIGGLLSAHFFVEVIILSVWMPAEGRHGRAIEVTGTPENVEMAEYVYAFLDRTADALWAEHKRAHGVRGDRDRRAFRAGVMAGFHAKLDAERGRAVAKGLVWVGDPRLKTHQRARYPRVHTSAYGGSGDTSARLHGREAGKKVVLHRGVGDSPGGGGSGGRLLGSGG